MIVVSYGSLTFGSGVDAYFVDTSFTGLPSLGVARTAVTGNHPILSAIERQGKEIRLELEVATAADRKEMHQTFDPEQELVRKLIVADDDGSNQRYVMASCYRLQQVESPFYFEARLVIDRDVRWRSVTEQSQVWNIAADNDTLNVSNDGEDDAYPRFTLTPTAEKSGHNIYKRWVSIIWNALAGATDYPIDLTDGGLDTATLVSGGKMQADGDDIRVVVDGEEVDFWLHDMNTANTKIWANVDFVSEPSPLAELESNIGSLDSITSIDSTTDISDYPSSGILLINSEAFVYTGKNNSLGRFTGVTRAAKGTTAAAHTAGDTIHWIQKDIWITYGNTSAAAPDVDDDYKPAFLLSSTNTSWDYDNFGEDDGLRPQSWRFVNLKLTSKYTADQATDADPWEEVGVEGNYENSEGRWQFFQPCGIATADFQNGHKYASKTAKFGAEVIGGATLVTQYIIPAPSAGNTWETWSQTGISIGGQNVGLRLRNTGTQIPGTFRVEVADVTLSLDTANTPTIVLGAEQGNYPLACILRNNTTGDELHITFTMTQDESLEVDTYHKTVTYLDGNSNQFSAVDVIGTPRVAWLKLQPGSNELYFEDVGTQGITIDVEWEERFYD